MVCDFFYPSAGGVENHVHQLAQCLLRLGHKVIVITHRYGQRTGVRWLAGGLKVYHVPFSAVYDGSLLPTAMLLLPLLRDILVRENITTVHAHAVCTMSLEAVVLAALMGYRVVYTEHSNFGTSGVIDASLNRLSQAALSHADALISVSRTCQANMALRCKLPSDKIAIIPNAVDASHFKPDSSYVPPAGRVVVIVLTRLVWRKGVQLLADLLPEACARHPDVDFVIGGDGPKRGLLEATIERHGLDARVEMLGHVAHRDVPAVLTRGRLFLHTSLTEAFCIAILEAVCCGLTVVSTNVGGVPELLPAHMVEAGAMVLADPTCPALLAALDAAMPTVRARDDTARIARSAPGRSHRAGQSERSPRPGRADTRINSPADFHSEVASLYSWMQVARRTARLYDALEERPRPALRQRLGRLLSSGLGPLSATLALLVVLAQALLLGWLRLWRPAEGIERAPDLPADAWARTKRGEYESLPVRGDYLRSLTESRTFVR